MKETLSGRYGLYIIADGPSPVGKSSSSRTAAEFLKASADPLNENTAVSQCFSSHALYQVQQFRTNELSISSDLWPYALERRNERG